MLKRNRFYIIITSLTIFLLLSGCGSNGQKKKNAKEALSKKLEEHQAAEQEAANDTTPPVISSVMDEANYEVDDTIDYERIKMALKATDNIDGDLTSSIIQIESDVVEHQEGEYEITYEVEDSAGNKSTFILPVNITSKYSSDEKKRLNNCIKAYNKLGSVLKSPSSLNLYNINTDQTGSIVVLNYSAQNSFGAHISGRVAYFSSEDLIVDLEDEEIPNDFTIGEFVYTYDDIKDFSDYYHVK